jgi:hypothetical protein
VLALFSGDGVGVLQIDGAIDDPQVVLNELRRFKEMPVGQSDRRAHRFARWRGGANARDF